MMSRKKALLKRSSEEINRSSREEMDATTPRQLSNGKQKHHRHSSAETESKEILKGEDATSKGNLKSSKYFAKRHGYIWTAASKRRNFDMRRNSDSSATTTHLDGKFSSKPSGCSLDLDDMRYPAEYVPPAVDNIRRRSSAHRVSYRKAIQKAGYNMNELAVTPSNGSVPPSTQQKPSPCLTDVDWSENASSDHHIWAPTNASGELCYVGEDNCQKSGPRKKCDACHIVVHENCFPQLLKIAFCCKTTFRESSSRNSKESPISHHHWVHRRKQEGKCKRCGKSFEKRFGFREPTKIIAISCSWCKEAYHNKVNCFHIHKINEPCNLGVFNKSIVPSTWIVKSSQKQKSLRSRSKKRKSGSGLSRKKPPSKEYRPKTFAIRPLSQQAAFLSPILVFINPKSGGRQGAKLLQSFRWFLNPRQVFDLTQESPLEALELYRKVPNLRVLACGGDGTVGWILSVLDKLSLARPPPVAVLPLGTGNDLSRTLNFGPGYTDEPVKKIIVGVEEAQMVKLDRWKLLVEKNEDAMRMSMDEEGSTEPSDGTDKPPLEVINNYFSIGADAQVSFNFHESREAHPAKFTSRFGNKIFYARAGVYEYVSCQSKNLWRDITVVCDGVDITPKIHNLKPVCILFLNIPKYSSGMSPWGHPTGNEFHVQSYNDKLIEVLAFTINQLGMLFVGGHGERLCQCKSAIIQTRKTFPIQIDGEPCKLNPSNIELQFFNQANMLTKHKRRQSVGLETQPSHEQIKIRINVIKSENFENFRGKREPLCTHAIPLLVTVAMNQSTLDTVRSCLHLIVSENEHAVRTISDKWIFLDSSSRDKLYKIDRHQENRLVVSDVISSDKEVYILDFVDSEPGQGSHVFNHRNNYADKLRNRIKSDSGVWQSPSSGFGLLTKNEPSNDNMKFTEIIGESQHSDPTSTLLDVVFEQPEMSPVRESASSYDEFVTSSATVDVIEEKKELPMQNGNRTLSKSSQSLENVSNRHSQTIDLSSEDSIFDDVVVSRMPASHVRSPLRAAHSHPTLGTSESDLSKAFSLQANLNEKTEKSSTFESNANGTPASHVLPDLPDETFETNEADNEKPSSDEQKQSEIPNGYDVFDATDHAHVTNEASANWNKLLLDSSKRGDCGKVCLAIENGADPCVRDDEGCTALHHAVRFSHEPIVDCLLKQNVELVDATCRDRKQSALHKAAWYGRTGLCKKLLAAGACLHLTDYKGMTAVDRAKQANADGLVDFFEKILESQKTGKPFHETDL